MALVTISPRPAPEPGALDGFAWSCAECGGRVVGTSSLASLARQGASAHAAWHASRRPAARVEFDATGSALGRGGHTVPLGARVTVVRYGAVQWEASEPTVIRHDRNRTYRLRFSNDTFVTVHEDEIAGWE